MIDVELCLSLLSRWAASAERYWTEIPGGIGMGCFGTGYNGWGVQTNQKYVGALATLAARGDTVDGLDCLWAGERALAALRFSLASHLSGPAACTDGTQWGHTWISALGIERMMYGVALLEPFFSDQDRADLRRVLTSEADWLLAHHRRGKGQGVFGNPWNNSGLNVPESNLWNGALLWRTAVRCPDHPHASDWKEWAHRFLINAVSVPSDADDATVVAGKPVRERFAGANFFPNYALDHHGYLNVGYMIICLSNAAMLHFDLKKEELPRPETLDRHQAHLWGTVRRMLFPDGRLCRIGGDSRVRYAYCQDYVLPALLYAADQLHDPHALPLASALIGLMEHEAAHSGDGSFYGRRLEIIRKTNHYYYCRLESDRACVLAMAAVYLPCLDAPPAPREDFESSVAGTWCEPEHGAVLHRSPTRLASFAWRAYDLTQGMCQPPGESDLAEWLHNLAGSVRFTGEQGRSRALQHHDISVFDGGFLTSGAVKEGMDLLIPEGWRGSDSALHQIVFAALPDGHSVVGLQHCRALARRVSLREVKGLRFNLPNDLYNGFRRTLLTERGAVRLDSPAARQEALGLGKWVSIEEKVGVVGLYGAEELVAQRNPARQTVELPSLYVDEICFYCADDLHDRWPGEIILDVGWSVLSSVGAEGTRRFAKDNHCCIIEGLPDDVRGVRVRTMDGRIYFLVANFGAAAMELKTIPPNAWERTTMLGATAGAVCGDGVRLPAGSAMLLLSF